MTPAIKITTEERYDEMLNILPPALWRDRGFLVGEPHSHRTCKVRGQPDQPTFAAFFYYCGHHFESVEAMTIPEFNAFLRVDLHEHANEAVRLEEYPETETA